MKRFIASVFIGLLLLANTVTAYVSACAYINSESYLISIESIYIPEDTAYIDLLLPISEEDEAYTEFNEANGEKYKISGSSEIANYCEDGYRSYTFNMKDAVSKIKPYTFVSFDIEEQVYEENKELLQSIDDYSDTLPNAKKHYQIKICLGDDLSAIKEISEKLGLNLDLNLDSKYLFTEYAFSDSDSQYNFEYCIENYEKIKVAYLDMDGNIIGVSNSVEMNIDTDDSFSLELTGGALTLDKSSNGGMNVIILTILLFIIAIVLAPAIVSFVQDRIIDKRMRFRNRDKE